MDSSSLTDPKLLAEILDTYGAWGMVAILMVYLFIREVMFSRKTSAMNETFQFYHEEIVLMNKDYSKSNKRESGAINKNVNAINQLYKQVKACTLAIEKQGIKVEPLAEEETRILEDFTNGNDK